MAIKIIAEMRLKVGSADPTVLAEFDKRFLRRLENSWSALVLDEADLAAQLDTTLESGVLQLIIALGDDTLATGIRAFAMKDGSQTEWVPSSGGQHEKEVPVVVKHAAGEDSFWGFNVGLGEPPQLVPFKIRATVVWRSIDFSE